MSDASWEIQKAVYTALNTALSVSVYDHVPQDTAPPFVAIGDDTIQDWSTKTFEGEENTITVHAWSRYEGRKETKQLLGQIKNALHLTTLSLTGFTNVLTHFDFEDTFPDADGLTYHGVIRFRLLTQKD